MLAIEQTASLAGVDEAIIARALYLIVWEEHCTLLERWKESKRYSILASERLDTALAMNGEVLARSAKLFRR